MLNFQTNLFHAYSDAYIIYLFLKQFQKHFQIFFKFLDNISAFCTKILLEEYMAGYCKSWVVWTGASLGANTFASSHGGLNAALSSKSPSNCKNRKSYSVSCTFPTDHWRAAVPTWEEKEETEELHYHKLLILLLLVCPSPQNGKHWAQYWILLSSFS